MLMHRVASVAVEWALCRPRRKTHVRDGNGKVEIVLLHAYGIGGAIRSVFNLAEELAKAREVELISVVREWEAPMLPLPPGVHVACLDDRRSCCRPSLLARTLSAVPSLLMHPDDEYFDWFTLRSDILLLKRVRAKHSGVLLTTRPALNAFAARYSRKAVLLIAQEHTNLGVLPVSLRAEVKRTYGGTDAVVLLTERDQLDYKALLARSSTRILAIPNAVPRLPGTPMDASLRRPAVIAAGRLAPQKGFDLLIAAFALVAADYPDWVLEIYGGGPDSEALSVQVDRARLSGVAFMAGPTDRIGEVMAESAVFALSSRYEGLPMVILEALEKEMAIVAFDCPTGVRELLTHGVNGLVVPPGSTSALAAALSEVMGDVSLRARLGKEAGIRASHFQLADVGRRWTQLMEDLSKGAREPRSAPREARPI